MSVLINDLRFALRTFGKQPGFSFMIVAMLALGIAGATTIFSIHNALFLRPLPFPEATRLLDLDETAPKWNLEYTGVAYQDFHSWREHNRSFDGMAVWAGASFNLSGRFGTQRLDGMRVSHDMAAVLGVKPVLGRGISPDEDKPGAPKVILLGHALWQRLFSGSKNVIGETLQLDGEAYTVIGVLPREAVFSGNSECWAPLQANPTGGGGWFLGGVGRLKKDVTISQALEDLTRIHRGMIQTGRKVNEITSPAIRPLRDRLVGNYWTASSVLLGAVAVVLLIACVNIAGLMLARGSARSREMGVRTALGATRRRIIRQLLTESLLLACAGGALGVGLGFAGLKGLMSTMPNQLPRWVTFNVDIRILLFCISVSAAAAVLFGLWPAREASRVDVRSALQDAARSSASAGKRRTLNALVVGEVALAVVLLVGAGLLIQAFRKLREVDPGFRADGVLTYRVALPNAKYAKPDQRKTFFDTLLDQLRSMPGVQFAGACSNPPLFGHSGYFLEAEGAPPLGPNEKNPVVLLRTATPGYLEALGIRFIAGRPFDNTERSGGPRVVIINETLAKHFFRGVDPLGRRLRQGSNSPWMTVIGVTADVKHYGLEREMRPGVYVPYSQGPVNSMNIVMKGSVDPHSLVSPARLLLAKIDPDLPMYQITTMSARVEESLWVRRTYSWLLGVFAAVALVLAAGGIYGVISFTVSQRTREIGIRMALGAEQRQVLWQVLLRGMMLVGLGLGLGLAGAFWSAGFLRTLLFGVSATDGWTYAGVAALLAGVALLANAVPARRAAAINPVTALRFE
ncbi:MAG: ABC transporter permease [Bryobacteraceae bacterium]